MSNLEIINDNSPLVLAVDTSSAVAGFALARGEQLLASINGDAAVPHSRAFFPQISELLNSAGVCLSDIQLLAVATGPGSFTGLRVGLAAVKGLAHALGNPLVGMNSFDAVALAAKVRGDVVVLLEAGRHEVYFGVRRISESGLVESIGEDLVGTPEKLVDLIPSGQIITGAVPETLLASRPDLQFRPSSSTPAEQIALSAPKLLGAGNTLRPHYVRPSDAEIKRKD